MHRKLFFLFFFVAFSSFAGAQCSFYLLDVQNDYSFTPASIFPKNVVSLNVGVENTSDSCTALDVNAVLVLNENYFEPLGVSDSVSSINSRETKSLIFRFKVKDGIPGGSYKGQLNLSYRNFGSLVEKSFDIVVGVKECFSLDIEDVSYSAQPVYAGVPLQIFANVRNSCSGIARDVQVELKPVTNSSFDPFVLLSSNFLQVGDILPGKYVGVSFSVRPIEDAGPKIYVFRVDANCFDCSKAFSDIFSFEVLAKPVMIYSGVDFSNQTRSNDTVLLPGDNFSFSVQVDNIGKKTARAAKVSLLVDGQIVGAKESFIGNIDPEDSGAAVFDLSILANASVGEHKAVITTKYLDEVGLEQSFSENYSFYVAVAPSNIFGLIVLLVLVVIILVVLYFLVKMVFRQLALRKSKFR